MAHITLIWELGAGLGHLARLRAVADVLATRGHRLSLVARPGSSAERLFPDMECRIAPRATAPAQEQIREPASFAEILFNAGCCDATTLTKLIQAWRTLFDALQADIAILDFAPFALLALQGHSTRRVLLGTGFACPPDVSPLPDLRPWQNHYPDRLLMNELSVLELMNRQLTAQDQPVLERVASLFTRVELNLLAGFPALDHYPQRRTGPGNPAVDYVGPWSAVRGAPPHWPAGSGARVFAYLKPFAALPKLLQTLEQCGLPTLVYLAGSDPRLKGIRFGPTLHRVEQPVDIQRAAREADLAILHAGHGASTEMLLAGTPILQIPLVVEQVMVANCTARLGASLAVSQCDAAQMVAALDHLLTDARWREAARAFARQHADFDLGRTVHRVADRIERLFMG